MPTHNMQIYMHKYQHVNHQKLFISVPPKKITAYSTEYNCFVCFQVLLGIKAQSESESV